MTKRLKIIFILAFFLRLLVAPLAKHSDVIDNLNWGRNLVSEGFEGFYRRDIPDAGPPNYPPLYYYINFANQLLYEDVKGVLWKINVVIPAFPSTFYIWFESQAGNILFNKLPAIFADIGIAYVLYKFVRLFKNTKMAENTAALFLFLPAPWYVSAVWGQTDSLFILPLLASLLEMQRKNFIWASTLYLVSLLIKPTGIFLLPLFAFLYAKNFKFKSFFYTSLISVTLMALCALPFLEHLGFRDFVDLYKNNIREVTGYLTANSFNVWSLLYGFDPVSDSIKILGTKAYQWGEILYFVLLILTLVKLRDKNPKSVLLGFVILALGTFAFMTKMHERYYFLPLALFSLLYGIDKKLRGIYFLVSLIFFINLYHFWWMPKISFFVYLLSLTVVEKSLAILNILIFLTIFRRYIEIARSE